MADVLSFPTIVEKGAMVRQTRSSSKPSEGDVAAMESEEEKSADDRSSASDSNSENEDESRIHKDDEPEPCSFDLRNLLVANTHQIDTSKLYSRRKNKTTEDSEFTILTERMEVVVNEDLLLQKATDSCSKLVAALWQLPTSKTDAGPMVTLPSYDASNLPRELPPPPPKQDTKWEKFAKERGIALNKEKRSKKVWDEATGSWMFRHGYQKANAVDNEWPIMEVKANQDPYEDPWERQREEKLQRKNKNVESHMRNQERAGNLARGSTSRVLKSKQKVRQAGKLGGNLDRDHVPAGVPVDLRATKTSGDVQSRQRGKVSTVAALKAAQKSSASLGKFDKMLEGEPERPKMGNRKKRKLEISTGKRSGSNESERSMKLFKSVIEGGGVEKEKARRKGQLASGETAYDYDFDDGLGPSSFKKKKGRAGAGKMKKMTKKRAK